MIEWAKIMFPYDTRSVKGRFSRTEIKHLALASVLFAGVMIGWLTGGFTEDLEVTIFGVVVFFVLIITAFLLHEIAHKFKAQSYGLWSEFRLQTSGVYITLAAMLFGFLVFAPGATMVVGYPDKKSMGKIALSGPLTNLFMAGFFLLLYPISPTIAWLGVFFNALIAIFNLLPFFVLDGKKVLQWNPYVWSGVFFLLLSLLIYVTVVLPWSVEDMLDI